MPVLALNREELLTLSSYSSSSPNEISIINRFIERQTPEQNSVSEEVKNNFVSEGFLAADADGTLKLAKEITPVMFILHRPQQVISLRRIGESELGEVYFVRNGNVWVQCITRNDGLYETYLYPMKTDEVRSWFCNQLLTNISFGEPYIDNYDSELTMDETIILFVIQNIYKKRIASKIPLEKEDMWIGYNELQQPNNLDDISGLILALVSKEQLIEYVSRKDRLKKVVQTLCNKGLLQIQGEIFSYNSISKIIFDPGNLNEIIIAKDVTLNKGTIKTLSILSGGCVVFEPLSENLGFKLSAIPGTIDKNELFSMLFDINDDIATMKEPIDDTRINCKNCNSEISSGAKFCHICGNPVDKMQEKQGNDTFKCSSCSTELKKGVKFCHICGKPV